MKIIAGLGNPGKEYEHTRHNMGFDVIDILADRWKVASWKKDMKADIATVIVGGEKVLLVKPLTYMNLSGEAVGAMTLTCRRERRASVRRDRQAGIMGSSPSLPALGARHSIASASV